MLRTPYRAYFRACRAEPCLAIGVERGASMTVTRGSQGASLDKALDVCSPTTKNIIIRNEATAPQGSLSSDSDETESQG